MSDIVKGKSGRACSTTEDNKDAELKTTRGTPVKAASRTGDQATVGSDPV